MRLSEKVERAIVESVIAHLEKHGFTLRAVMISGEERSEKVAGITQALRVVFEVYAASHFILEFRSSVSRGDSLLVVIPGNGEDVISNWTTGDSEFDEVMKKLVSKEMYVVRPVLP